MIGSCEHGEAGQTNQKAGILCNWLRVCVRLSLVGPKLEAETKIRESVSY